ncbi:helix-turn-helix domain-containing protein [Lacticaseibacillus hulanensis]|uniref:helix-turn-helix domain-containing protein n=1 Tax=Lacticaseibacillus hulanensis TaxID=2493111 RepID=UPI000FDA7093|nr:helix-turn-helix transcriptional regulator [Lacticaseibacillus hulanensis]
MAVGEQIKQLRSASGLKQSELAEQLVVTRATISNWETGRSEPSLVDIERLSAVINVLTDYLLHGQTDADVVRAKKRSFWLRLDNYLRWLPCTLGLTGTVTLWLIVLTRYSSITAGGYVMIFTPLIGSLALVIPLRLALRTWHMVPRKKV